jgi:hypothetical protein
MGFIGYNVQIVPVATTAKAAHNLEVRVELPNLRPLDISIPVLSQRGVSGSPRQQFQSAACRVTGVAG